jgi:hypothetical protein
MEWDVLRTFGTADTAMAHMGWLLVFSAFESPAQSIFSSEGVVAEEVFAAEVEVPAVGGALGVEGSLVEADDAAAVAGDGAFVVEIGGAVVVDFFSSDRAAQEFFERRLDKQSPGLQDIARFEHKIPVKGGLVMNEDDVTGHVRVSQR